MKNYSPFKHAEFIARQLVMDFGAFVQRAIDDSRASLTANLAHIKKSWSKWFPAKVFPLDQIILDLNFTESPQ